jgi:hypothetical protein
MLLRLLVGKLNEANILVDKSYFGTQLSRDYGPVLDQTSLAAIKSIRRYFASSGNLVHRVRNAVAFHYSAPEIGASLEKVKVNEELDFYLAPNLPNTLYYFAEVMVAWTMLGEMTTEALQQFMDETGKVARWFIHFMDGFIAAFSDRHRSSLKDTDEGASAPVDIQGAPDFEVVQIPWFTTIRRP